MVITPKPSRSTRAFLILDLVVGMAMLVLAVFPLAYTVNSEARLFRATYQRALAMEIVDGEMEVLAAGEWRAYSEGTQTYSVQARAAAACSAISPTSWRYCWMAAYPRPRP